MINFKYFSRSLKKFIALIYLRIRWGVKVPSSTFVQLHQKKLFRDLVLGHYSFIGYGCTIYPRVSIGDYVLIAPEVRIVGGDHFIYRVGTPIIFSGRDKIYRTVIEDDVWIGTGAFIKAGVKIGVGSIVAAHSVVTKDVPPFSIVAGNPAVVKKSRFNLTDQSDHLKMLNANSFDKRYVSRI